VKQISWKKDDLVLYSQSTNNFIIWNIETRTKILEFKPTYRLEGGFVADRDDKIIYLASDDGSIHALCNGQVKIIDSFIRKFQSSFLSDHQ
jgi:hypothetical protein